MNEIRIGLAWHAVNNGNLGVAALTAGNIALARRAAAAAHVAPRFTVFGVRDSRPVNIAGADIDNRVLDFRYLLTPAGYGRDAAAQDIILDINGGDSFTDIYPAKRQAMIFLTKYLAYARGTPVLFSPQTIGPFSRALPSALARGAMRRAAAVFTRDPQSADAVRRMTPDVQPIEAVDVAFALPFTRPERAPGPVRVGLNVSGLLYGGGYTGKNEFGIDVDYAALTDALIARFLEMPGVEAHLVPHVYSTIPTDDDGRVADALHARHPALRRHPDFASASEAKSFISGLDFLVGARMHATIAAYSSGVPVVPVSYSRKFEGLFGGLGYPWLVPVKGKSTAEATAFVLEAFARREELRADIARGARIVEAGLERYVAELATRFSAIAARKHVP